MINITPDINLFIKQAGKTIIRLRIIITVFYFIFLSCILSPVHCQEYKYVPFPDSGAIWSEIYYNPIFTEPAYILERFALSGEDTVINELVYKKLYIFYDTVFNKDNASYIGGIREDSLKRVYFKGDTIIHEFKPMIDLYNYEEIMLFDFSLKIGDTIKDININCRPHGDILIVTNIDTVQIGNYLRKRYHFWLYTWVQWIEGIGNIKGLLFTSGDLPTNGLDDDLICYKQNDTILYFNENYTDCIPVITGNANKEFLPSEIKIYPNPVTGNFIRFDFGDAAITSIKVINCKGMVMACESINNNPCFSLSTEKYPRGIYFYIATNTQGIARTGKLVVQ